MLGEGSECLHTWIVVKWWKENHCFSKNEKLVTQIDSIGGSKNLATFPNIIPSPELMYPILFISIPEHFSVSIPQTRWAKTLDKKHCEAERANWCLEVLH